MRVFFDTSAFAKRYIEEPGTDKVIEICRQAEHLVLCVICLPEMISTFNIGEVSHSHWHRGFCDQVAQFVQRKPLTEASRIVPGACAFRISGRKELICVSNRMGQSHRQEAAATSFGRSVYGERAEIRQQNPLSMNTPKPGRRVSEY
jgi:hypothetical protein